MGLFDNRITGSVAYFDNNTKDLLLSLPMSLTTGHTSQTKNLGKLNNNGLEFELDLDALYVLTFQKPLKSMSKIYQQQ